MIWLWIFNGSFGLLNYGLSLIGIEGPNWLTDPAWTMPSLVLMSVWGIGHAMVIYLAALQDVPRQLYEVGRHRRRLLVGRAAPRHPAAHLPGHLLQPDHGHHRLAPGLRAAVHHDAERGPEPLGPVLRVYLYENAFSYLNMGYACAMAWVLFLIILGLTWLATQVHAQTHLLRRGMTMGRILGKLRGVRAGDRRGPPVPDPAAVDDLHRAQAHRPDHVHAADLDPLPLPRHRGRTGTWR